MQFHWYRVFAHQLSLALVFLCSIAQAELSPIERATAEALFQEGISLLDRADYELACEKFAGTLEIEQGLGTMLHLADCYDKLNRTASSWALFEEVASRAKLAGDATRESIALARASELKARLSLVYLEFEGAIEPRLRSRLKITIGETLIPTAMWDSSIPLDPGMQPLKVSAEGYAPWTFAIVVAPGPSLRRVTVPPLAPSVLVTVGPRTTKRPIVTSPPRPNTHYDPRPSSTPRVIGYVSGALGLVGLAVSGYFGYRAYESQRRSLDSCRTSNSNLCTAKGVDRREQAFRYADAANISAIAGGSSLVLGTTLLIVSPSAPAEPTAGTGDFAVASPTYGTPTVSLRRTW